MQTLNDDSDDPVKELAAIAELRRGLAAREAMAVRRARHAGLNWSSIATVLGVSKQAVHKKYGKQ